MSQPDCDVLVIGAGPVGLTLACELARRGVAVRIVDKSAAPSPYCRAIGITPRTLEIFENMGIVDEIIDSGLWIKGARTIIAGGPARDTLNDYPDLPFSHLGAPQYATESVLTRHLKSLGVIVERNVSFAGLQQEESGATVELDTPNGRDRARFRYIVGCDGAHSPVRHALGIAFEGDSFPMEFMLGDVHIDWDLPRGMSLRVIKPTENGAPDFFVAIPLPEAGRYRVSMLTPNHLSMARAAGTDHGIQSDRPGATLADIQEVADRLLPSRTELTDMRWSSIFRISMRLASRYRDGNVFLAGDACHIHPPTGGQGMNTGIQDACNLAWKMALVLKGASPLLLNSYEAERRPVAADVVARTTEESVNFGKPRTPPHRLQDTQILLNYRDSALSRDMLGASIRAGDRMPDMQGLGRAGRGFPSRLFDLLNGHEFTLLAAVSDEEIANLLSCSVHIQKHWPNQIRIIGLVDDASEPQSLENLELVSAPRSALLSAMGTTSGAWLVRPDHYVGLTCSSASAENIDRYLETTIGMKSA